MTLPNSSNNYDKEVHQESYTDEDGNVYQSKQTTEKVKQNGNYDSYNHGYIHGQAVERSQRRRIIQRDEDNTSRGLLLGGLLATIAILAGGFIWYINQRDNDVNPVTPIIIPNADKPEASPSPSPTIEPQTRQESKSETTIIEKVREVPIPVPVPQPEAPKPQTSQPQSSQPAIPQQSSQPQTEININPVTPENSQPENNSSESNSQPQSDANSDQNTAQ